ncbi:MAG TPA: DUF29 domain-containing protein [Geminicoccaceae bacterium]|nr:DUF29 domain-containing protein [Geminicoccaceae bacterium]
MTTRTLGRPSHDTDFPAWAFDQACRLRELARSRSNEPIDWELLADEVEDMGRSELRAAEAFLRLALVHLLKLEFARDASPRQHWRKELHAFRSNFRHRTTPSVAARLERELDAVYDVARAEAIAAEWQDPELEDRLPRSCPYRFEQVTGEWLPGRADDADAPSA